MHEKRIDLRWRDLDAYGHVNQAVYLTFAEEVLDHWFQQKLGLRPGTVWDYVAARTTIEYRSELRLTDVQVVGSASLARLGTKSVTANVTLARTGRQGRRRARARRCGDRREGRREPAAHRAGTGGAGGAVTATRLDGQRSLTTHSVAQRAARVADPAAVPDQQVREAAPVRPRNELHQVALDLDRILVPRQPEALRKPAHVRVDHDALRVAELGRDDVGRLARDAGQPQQLLDRAAAPRPSNSSSSTRIVPRIDFVFWRKKPVA